MKLLTVSLLMFSASVFACASKIQSPISAKAVSLSELEKLEFNKVTEEGAIKLFGIAPMQVAKDQENKVVWLYYFPDKPKRQRMNLVFDSRSHLLKSIVWFVQEEESESNLKSALDHYSGDHFKRHLVQWQQNDFTSSQTTYVDNSKGVVIEVFEGHENEVSSLGWTIPGTIKERDGYITSVDSNKQWRIIVNNTPVTTSTNKSASQ